MQEKPNVLFFFTDDQRFDTIAALGNPEVKTPNLDELVGNGISFTQAHIPGGTVGAVCMPSRAMLHTGKTLFRLKDDGMTIPTDHVLLGETLQKAGYRTFGTGKWHNGTDSYARSFTDGGEIFFGGMNDHWNVPACDFDPDGQYTEKRKVIHNPYYSNKAAEYTCDHINAGKHSSELFCEAAADWIKEYNGENPFFMYVSFMAPHDPRSMPEQFLDMYDPGDISLPENFMQEHPFDYGVYSIRDEVLASYPRTEDEVRRHIAEYYGMITHLDNELGKVIDSLKEKGAYENTIIIFAGDNGLALGQHGLMGKQSNYEHSVRVPLIFSGPGIPRNEKRDTYAYLLDIYPTICEMLGLSVPASVEGKSLVPAIGDREAKHREILYFAFSEVVRGIKDSRYKLIEYRDGKKAVSQLFDLMKDPGEKENLYEHEEYAEIINRLKADMINYKEKWDDEKHPKGKIFWERYKNGKQA